MDTTQTLIKERQQRQIKLEISYLKSSVIGAMGFFDMADQNNTRELYSKLDNVIVELIKLEQKLGIEG